MNPVISIIILAAGASTRMKTPKQLLPWRGKTLIEQVVATAKGINAANIYLVLGANSEEIMETLSDPEVKVVVNDHWSTGMGSSIAAGVREAINNDKPDGILLMLSDQPLIDIDYINKLIDAYAISQVDIVGTAYPNKTGVPVIFGRSIFPQLLEINGDEGAWAVISNHQDNSISLDAGQKVQDLDTPEDYERMFKSDTNTL